MPQLNEIVSISMVMDTKINVGKRTVKDVLTLFGDIGGFSSLILTLFSLFIGQIPTKLLRVRRTEDFFRKHEPSRRS